ncbi:hypothetical protein P5673_017771 [Acropora cervicornis]|uniref:Uncharacterized protein n=1 Tax=Acropora cervicornis TaxID=6130 RepID=A0AAD9V397_ACRCE|nr:hypothetical protein P5673_017771 [Acropora cervicornis]
MARKVFGFQQLRNVLRTLGYILFVYLFSISSVDVLQQMVFAGSFSIRTEWSSLDIITDINTETRIRSS